MSGFQPAQRPQPWFRHPFIRSDRGKQVLIGVITALALAFPLLHDNDADIDSMANAMAYATLALGLNIVVGFAGLLDPRLRGVLRDWRVFLRHPDLVPAATRMELVLGAVRRPVAGGAPAWIRRPGRRAFHRVVLDHAAGVGDPCRALRRGVRRADPAAEGRLPRHRDARLRRDRADRGAQLVLAHQRRHGPERCRGAAHLRLPVRHRCRTILLRRGRHGRPAGLRQRAAA